MSPEQKLLKQQHIDTIQKARGTPEAHAITALLDLLLEDAKTNLITATGDDLLRVQGEARTYQALTNMLSKQRMAIKPQE